MSDTNRAQTDLLTIFADNTTQEISPQDARDFIVSTVNRLPVTAEENTIRPDTNTVPGLTVVSSDGTGDLLVLKSDESTVATSLDSLGNISLAGGVSATGDISTIANVIALGDISGNALQVNSINGYVSGLDFLNSVISQTNTPPGSPTELDRYLVDTSGMGLWSSYSNEVVYFYGGNWNVQAKTVGSTVYVEALSKYLVWDSSAWVDVPTYANTASRALVSGADKKIQASSVTSTELGYVSGVTSAIQTQLDGKQAADTELGILATVTAAADKVIYFTSNVAASTFTCTAASRAMLSLTGSADTLFYTTSSSAASSTTLTSFGRSLIDDADAQTARATLGVNRKSICLAVFAPTVDTATGDGKIYYQVPSIMNGLNVIRVAAAVITAGTTNTTDVQIARIRSGTPVDVLSTKLTIDSGEVDTSTAATAAVINTSNDDLATNDLLRIDIDQVSTTPAKGLLVTIEAEI